MKKLLILLFLIFSIASIITSVKAENVLYCESELATGFIKKNGIWEEGSFVRKRFTVNFNNEYTKLKGLDEYRDFTCSKVYSNVVEHVYCISGWLDGDSFQYNPLNNRFKYLNPSAAGFIVLEGKDTDIMYAGTCKSF